MQLNITDIISFQYVKKKKKMFLNFLPNSYATMILFTSLISFIQWKS